MYKKSILFQKV